MFRWAEAQSEKKTALLQILHEGISHQSIKCATTNHYAASSGGAGNFQIALAAIIYRGL